jgi:hypothetical protein
MGKRNEAKQKPGAKASERDELDAESVGGESHQQPRQQHQDRKLRERHPRRRFLL